MRWLAKCDHCGRRFHFQQQWRIWKEVAIPGRTDIVKYSEPETKWLCKTCLRDVQLIRFMFADEFDLHIERVKPKEN